ncbi:uncharacterized protein LOC134350031 isoform X2 [Mobula hypostoma]|uniref:uncharacterized protein LOC134350031 isoform X2 n=1 Tax=Mobula hypostoma TaxID=723540 RepID=UPI002FC3161B
MFAAIITILTLSVCTVGVNAETVLIQSPGVVKVPEGGTVRIQCDLESDNVEYTVDKYDVHWYNSPNEIVLSLYTDGRVYRSRGFSDRFQLSRNVTTNSYSLTISDVMVTDPKLYICGIWGTVFGNGTQLNVTSADVPVLIQSPSVQRVTEGHTAWLWCTMSKARLEDTDVHWYRKLPGQDMEWVLTHRAGGSTERGQGFTERFQSYRDTSNSSFTLTVTDVVHSDSAVYYCRVWGDIDGNGTQLIVTNPADDPVLVQDPPISKVPEGVTVQLHCALYNASVTVTDVQWYHQRPGNKSEWALSHFVNDSVSRSGCISDRFQSYRNVVSNSYILTISNTSISDTAVYNCSVWSYIYGGGTQLNVTVANPPVLIQSPSQENITEGQSARLWCTMKNARVGNIDVHWYRRLPGQDMEWVLTHEAGGSVRRRPGFTERFQPSRNSSRSSFILIVTKVEVNDSADYYCRVWGDISGNGSRLIVITDEGGSSKVLASILVSILVLVILFCILITAICYMKKWACFQQRLKPEGCSTEDLNTVYATVAAETEVNTQAATNVTASEESEIFYADIQFFQQKTAPKIKVTEETTEYAVIKRD